MRNIAFPVLIVAAVSLAGAALSQTLEPPGEPASLPAEIIAEPEPDAAAPVELSEADMNADPFPPGQHAALVKQICTECHPARLMLDIRYTREDAENYYINMVDDDVTTDQAQKIITYLSTTMGVDF